MDEIKIFVSGDFVPNLRVRDYVEKEDIEGLFNDVLPLINSSDFAITNLEAPLIEKGKPILKTGPNLKASLKSAHFLKNAGFDMVTLANNHLMDYGVEGLHSTMKICKEENLICIGAGDTVKEASKIVFKVIKGKTIAFINCCENEWSTTFSESPGANALNEVAIFYQIKDARENADFVILIIHGGHETYGLPSPRMKKLYRWFIDLGVDAVIGHHTHCFSGDEIYKGKPIVYSLGNFIFDHKINRNSSWNECVIAVLEILDRTITLKLIPLYQCSDKVGVHLMNKEQEKSFISQRLKKSNIIKKDILLEAEFENFVNKQFRMYNSFLEPIKNKYILWLMNRGILPRFVKGYFRRLLLNVIRTEAHRDILLKVLSK